jgi:hypothetical protein
MPGENKGIISESNDLNSSIVERFEVFREPYYLWNRGTSVPKEMGKGGSRTYAFTVDRGRE